MRAGKLSSTARGKLSAARQLRPRAIRVTVIHRVAWSERYAMPSFGAAYTDAEVATVANYAIAHFGGKHGQVTAKDWRTPGGQNRSNVTGQTSERTHYHSHGVPCPCFFTLYASQDCAMTNA
jgi:hypothetical protein